MATIPLTISVPGVDEVWTRKSKSRDFVGNQTHTFEGEGGSALEVRTGYFYGHLTFTVTITDGYYGSPVFKAESQNIIKALSTAAEMWAN